MPAPETDQAERRAIRSALVALIGEQGYAETELDEVLERSGIDRTTFERHFQTLDGCFAEVWRLNVQELAAGVLNVYAEAGNWRDGIRAQAWELCRMVVEDEPRARICMVEVNFGGDLVQATRDIVLAGYVELIHLGRHEAEDGEQIPKARAEAAVGAIWERVGRTINAGELDTLVEDVPGLLYLAYMPYLGPERARDELRRAEVDVARFRSGELPR